FQSPTHHRDLHSFPTRRSSDLDGQPVTAEDCVASIKRWGAKDAVGRLMMAALSKMAPVDRKTFTIDLETPFGLVLDALGKPSARDRKSTRLNSSHDQISYAVFC